MIARGAGTCPAPRGCAMIGLTDVPACGGNAEVLAHHGLDPAGIAARRALARHVPAGLIHWIDDVEGADNGPNVRKALADRRFASSQPSRAATARRAASSRRGCRSGRRLGRLSAPKRGEILGRAAALARERSTSSPTSSRLETGKPWKNAVAEVASSADLAVFMESEGSRFYGKTMTSPIAESFASAP